MENPSPDRDQLASRLGYAAAIVVSGIGHLALAVLVFLVIPRYLSARTSTPQVYSVDIVGELPAGDLGTHLPKLAPKARELSPLPDKPEEPKVVAKNEPPPEDKDKSAIALNTLSTPTPEPTVAATIAPPVATPTPAPVAVTVTPEATPTPAPVATVAPTTPAAPTPTERSAPKPSPKARSTPEQSRRPRPAAKPSAMIARAAATPSIQERLNKVREKLLADQLAKKDAEGAREEDAANKTETGGGAVAASRATEGKGSGIGPGSGSAGIQQDPEFLLYYRTVEDRVKKAWSFSGGNSQLETIVTFAIGADGSLTDAKVTHSSRDSAYDDSVIRAVRRAAPFPPPPQKYRAQFGEGVEAVFRLGELSS